MANKIQKILTIENKRDEKFLRQKAAAFDFEKYNRKEISDLVKQMRETMKANQGVGLSANQVGLDLKFFVVGMPQENKAPKFYTIFNPEIVKFSKEKDVMEEGCLSVPGVCGLVERSEKITIIGQDKNAKKIKIKAWGLLARVFQHETDHLNGILFIDKTKQIRKISTSEEKTL